MLEVYHSINRLSTFSDKLLEQLNVVIAAVQSRRGKVLQRYPPGVIIGQDGQDILDALRALGGVSGVYTAPVDNPEGLGLDEE